MESELRNRIIVFFAVLVAGLIVLLPTIFQFGGALKEKYSLPLPDGMNEVFKDSKWLPQPISLGLDLRGGVHLVYEVQTKEAVKSRMQSTANAIRSALRTDKVAVVRVAANDKNQVEITLLNKQGEEKAKNTVLNGFKELSFVGSQADEGDRVKLSYGISEVQAAKIEDESVSQSIETLRNRVDQFGTSEPLIQRVGSKRILLQMPGELDIEKVKNLVGRVAKLEFRLVPNSASQANVITIKDKAAASVKVEDQALMTGDSIAEASVGPHEGQRAVFIKFTSKGTTEFSRLTTENVRRQLSIILDGVEYSRPVINEPIQHGDCVISGGTGGFSKDEAAMLKTVLKSGALSAPLFIVEERTVGPSLGAESIQKGTFAMLLGLAWIAIFMIIYYKKSGALAVGTLVLNLVLMLALLAMFKATLTLPGLAGLALTLGMAVDANVIIYERIRDEVKIGGTRDAAVNAGFHKAWSAIIDSNLTTLISGLILLFLGTGPIKGFAVTLCVGIATTIYSAVFVSRLGFDVFPMVNKKGVSV